MENILNSPVTLGLILANLAASIFAFNNPRFMAANLFHVGPILRERQYHRMMTSGFLHANLLHLGLNMYVLFSFGSMVERFMGSPRFLVMYMAALLGGSLWSLLENKTNPNYRAYGASGAVSGVIVVFALYAPMAGMGIILLPVMIPAALFVVLFIALSAYLSTRPNTIIGHDAHLGGALVGGLIGALLVPNLWSNFILKLRGLPFEEYGLLLNFTGFA